MPLWDTQQVVIGPWEALESQVKTAVSSGDEILVLLVTPICDIDIFFSRQVLSCEDTNHTWERLILHWEKL